MHRRVIPPSVAPWSRCEPRRLAGVRGVLTDIDDTLTTEGAIPMGVVAALAALREAGVPVIAVTGRPMGWSRAVARTRRSPRSSPRTARSRCARRRRSAASTYVDAGADTRAATPNACALSRRASSPRCPARRWRSDSAGRVTDIAVDHAEFAHLDAGADRARSSP